MLKALFLILFVPSVAWGFWPLAWDLGGERSYLGPLMASEKGPSGNSFTIRPLLFSYSPENGGEYDFFYPLGKSTPTKSYFSPLYMWKKSEDAEDWNVILAFWGHSKGRGYGGLFPFFGTMYNRFGRDELGFALWPLYSYTVSEGARKDNFFYPVFTLYSGAEEGFGAWPLYGQRSRPGVRRSTYAFWPIFLREDRNLDTDDPMRTFQIMPLYAQSVSNSRAGYNALWPFFSYFRDTDRERWFFPWPVLAYSRGKETKGFRFLPFIDEEIRGQDRELKMLWPLYSESEWYVGGQRYLYRRVGFVNRQVEEPGRSYVNVWPFSEQRRINGEERYFFPSILPFFRYEGFDRIIRPLITIMENRRSEERETVNFLWGLSTYERNGEDKKIRVAFLFEWQKKGEKTGFEILSGLYGRGTDGSTKIFFMPFGGNQDGPQ